MTNSPRYQVRKALGGWYVEDTSTYKVWTGYTRGGAVSLADDLNARAVATSDTGGTVEDPKDEPLLWLDMTGTDFDVTRQPVQGALFQEPDVCGTLDLFDTASE